MAIDLQACRNLLGPLLKWIKHRFPKPAIPVQVRVAPPFSRWIQHNLRSTRINARNFARQLRGGGRRACEQIRLLIGICASQNGMILGAYEVVTGILRSELRHSCFRVGQAFHFLEPDRVFLRLAQKISKAGCLICCSFRWSGPTAERRRPHKPPRRWDATREGGARRYGSERKLCTLPHLLLRFRFPVANLLRNCFVTFAGCVF
jgi:hypothetical protein